MGTFSHDPRRALRRGSCALQHAERGPVLAHAWLAAARRGGLCECREAAECATACAGTTCAGTTCAGTACAGTACAETACAETACAGTASVREGSAGHSGALHSGAPWAEGHARRRGTARWAGCGMTPRELSCVSWLWVGSSRRRGARWWRGWASRPHRNRRPGGVRSRGLRGRTHATHWRPRGS